MHSNFLELLLFYFVIMIICVIQDVEHVPLYYLMS